MLNLNLNINNILARSIGVLPTLALDFTTGIPSSLTGTGSTGLAQKLDNTYQLVTPSTNQPRRTDRGAVFEVGATNNIFPSIPLNGSGFSQGSTFSAVNQKTSVIPGQNAYEYVSDGTNAILSETTSALSGTFTSGYEVLSCLLETTSTSRSAYMFMEDTTHASQTMLALNLGNLNTTTPSLGSAVAGSTNQSWSSLNLGTGPNGGTLWFFWTSGQAIVTGGVRRIRVRPNGSATPTAGWSVILHHVQHELGQYPTSPIVSGLSAPGTRPITDDFKAPLANGTYNIRYSLQDGTHLDRLSQVISDGFLHIPTDLYQTQTLDAVSTPTFTNQRPGYVTKIEAWPQYTDLFLLGDSFAGTPTSVWTPYYMRIPRVFTNNSTFGGTMVNEADNWDGLSAYWGNVLIIMDGGLNAADQTGTSPIDSINRITAHLTLNPKKWLYIQSCPNNNSPNQQIGTAYYTSWALYDNMIRNAFSSNYVPTLAIMQSYANTTQDFIDIANGFWPSRLQQDGLHPNNLGSQLLCQIIANALYNKGW